MPSPIDAALAANLALQTELRSSLARLALLVARSAAARAAALARVRAPASPLAAAALPIIQDAAQVLEVAVLEVDPDVTTEDWLVRATPDDVAAAELAREAERRRRDASRRWEPAEVAALEAAVGGAASGEDVDWEAAAAAVDAATAPPPAPPTDAPAARRKRGRPAAPKPRDPPRSADAVRRHWEQHVRVELPWERWEDERIVAACEANKGHRWDIVAAFVGGGRRTALDCLKRYQRHLNPCMIDTHWSPADDAALKREAEKFGGRPDWQVRLFFLLWGGLFFATASP